MAADEILAIRARQALLFLSETNLICNVSGALEFPRNDEPLDLRRCADLRFDDIQMVISPERTVFFFESAYVCARE